MTVTLHIRYHQPKGDGTSSPVPMEPDIPKNRDGGNFWFDFTQSVSTVRDARQHDGESREEFCVRLQNILLDCYGEATLRSYDWWYRDAETGETLTKRFVNTGEWRNA